MEINVGLEIDKRYKLLEKIGEGGMGAVYLAQQLHVNRQVVLKLLKPDLCVNDEQVQRFRREAELASKLSHPNSVTTYDFNIYRGVPYIAMEALEGESLADLLDREERIGIEQAVHILKQVCASLKEAHEKGMVHRDLKPENIFILRNPVDQHDVKVLDFGIAKLMTHHPDAKKSNLTRNDMIYGTPQYMSPEQIRGKEVNAQSDVYAIAVILHQCLLGVLPYDSQVVVDILTQHLTQPIPQIDQYEHFSPDSALSFNRLIERGMAKNPKNRIQNVDEMAEVLESLLQTIEIKDQPIDLPPPPKKSKGCLWGIVLLGFILYACPLSPISPFRSWYPSGWHVLIPHSAGQKLEKWFPALSQGMKSQNFDERSNHGEFTADELDVLNQILGDSESDSVQEDKTSPHKPLESVKEPKDVTNEPSAHTSTIPKSSPTPPSSPTSTDKKAKTKHKNKNHLLYTHGVIRVHSPYKTKVYWNQVDKGETPITLVVPANKKHLITCTYQDKKQVLEITVQIKRVKTIHCFRK